MNTMKLVKLMYLLDRLSLDRRGVRVAGGDYLSTRNGPVTSELLDLINAGRLFGEPDQRREQSVSNRRDHDQAWQPTRMEDREWKGRLLPTREKSCQESPACRAYPVSVVWCV